MYCETLGQLVQDEPASGCEDRVLDGPASGEKSSKVGALPRLRRARPGRARLGMTLEPLLYRGECKPVIHDRNSVQPPRGGCRYMCVSSSCCFHYRDTSLIRDSTPLGPYRRNMPRAL